MTNKLLIIVSLKTFEEKKELRIAQNINFCNKEYEIITVIYMLHGN